MALIEINDYKVILKYNFGKKKVFDDNDMVKNIFNANKYFSEEYETREVLSYSNSFDDFVKKHKDMYSVKYLDIGAENKLLFTDEYRRNGYEFLVHNDKKEELSEWNKFKAYCKNEEYKEEFLFKQEEISKKQEDNENKDVAKDNAEETTRKKSILDKVKDKLKFNGN